MLYNEIDEILCIYKQNVEMLSIERERLTPQKKSEKEEKITHRVFGLTASLLRISDQILTQVQYESVRLIVFSFLFLFLLQNSRTVE
jgi:hypothetical protein